MTLPETYIIQKFYQFAGYPRYKKVANVYEAGCPICREGNSWGRKRRAYYIPQENVICCHNCGWYSNPIKWIMETGSLSYKDVVKEVSSEDHQFQDVDTFTPTVNIEYDIPKLPHDSINLYDGIQVEYYKDNPVILSAMQYIKSRRLRFAVNSPSALYISLTDKIHKNRLCIPFQDASGDIVHYQTRTILDNTLDDVPKYLSKLGSDKTVYGVNNVSDIFPAIYIFEGPIDSFFVENGVAIAGIQENSETSLTSAQEEMLGKFYYLKKIWVLDNQRNDPASMKKTRKLITQNEEVFIWPRNLSQFKDFNEMCVKYGLDEISNTFIDKNTYKGRAAQLQLV